MSTGTVSIIGLIGNELSSPNPEPIEPRARPEVEALLGIQSADEEAEAQRRSEEATSAIKVYTQLLLNPESTQADKDLSKVMKILELSKSQVRADSRLIQEFLRLRSLIQGNAGLERKTLELAAKAEATKKLAIEAADASFRSNTELQIYHNNCNKLEDLVKRRKILFAAVPNIHNEMEMIRIVGEDVPALVVPDAQEEPMSAAIPADPASIQAAVEEFNRSAGISEDLDDDDAAGEEVV